MSHGIAVDQEKARLCEACHQFVEDMKPHACLSHKHKVYEYLRRERREIDLLAIQMGMKGWKERWL